MPTKVTVHPTAKLAIRAVVVGLAAVLLVFGIQRLAGGSETEATSSGKSVSPSPLELRPGPLLIPTLALVVEDPTQETSWSASLARELSGQTEAPVEGGRVDVLTDRYAIEVDRLEKWHEAIGQAAHYALKSEMDPVAAIILEEWPASQKTSDKIALIDETCRQQGIKLILLRQSDAKSK